MITQQPNWHSLDSLEPRAFTCGYCHRQVASNKGYYSTAGHGYVHRIYICPNCEKAVFFPSGGAQFPRSAPGSDVAHLPKDISALYAETRNCVAAGACTSSVLTSRKILMHIAVAKGASPGEKFIKYVEYLDVKGYVPPDGHDWVDHIRNKSNEANHEIVQVTEDDAMLLVDFLEMLLTFVFDFPGRVKKQAANPAGVP